MSTSIQNCSLQAQQTAQAYIIATKVYRDLGYHLGSEVGAYTYGHDRQDEQDHGGVAFLFLLTFMAVVTTLISDPWIGLGVAQSTFLPMD